ncbi:hypothetical protein BGM26_14045 [Bacillus sp. FJAT-29790]|uniref:hypothetical protein n=1 Tax=Bacillus sp. FJAT-29790 TaxID=1895002 RepID=UPI001C224E7C|nr:hypothetical protein [Bacillus sp. FJAT-29790]MBU8880100.1 hypothetical protein [Bacillus sp. FJAT-29790]
MRPKWSKWVLKLLWFPGLLGLLFISNHFELIVKQKVTETFIHLPLFWFYSIVPFIFGVYISLLFVKKWLFKMNKQLFLCVTVPCLIISFYFPIVATFFSNAPIPFVYWIINPTSTGIASIVAGLTFMLAFFGADQQSAR